MANFNEFERISTPNTSKLDTLLEQNSSVIPSLKPVFDELAKKLSYLYKIAIVIKSGFNITEDHFTLFTKTLVDYETYLHEIMSEIATCDATKIEEYRTDLISAREQMKEKESYKGYKEMYQREIDFVKSVTAEELRSAILFRLERSDVMMLDFQVKALAGSISNLTEEDIKALDAIDIEGVVDFLIKKGCYQPYQGVKSHEQDAIECVEHDYSRASGIEKMTSEVWHLARKQIDRLDDLSR